MASTSSSLVQKCFKYDVFLSFRGEDTRKTFVDHLYHALHNRGITTYKDDERIEKGGKISDQLIQSIEDSRIYIIVFSKNYASSSWCLDELVKIIECEKTTEHTAYPVFYDVEPTEVRNQSGVVGDAFAKHIEQEDVGRWRDALKEAAGLAGWEVKNTVDGHEAKIIQIIVEEVSLKLHFIDLSFDGKLVGMETRVNNVISSIAIGFEDVRMIGIKGMGGGGKTTLARAVFDHISILFEGKSFVDNVRESSKGSGLKELQKQVLKDVLNDQNIIVTSVYDGKSKMKKMMGGRKVLVVLDDVDDIDQLEALAGEPNWFKPGSRIIVTTRDAQVLVAHRINIIHDVNLLSIEEAICLFNKYAFGRKIPDQGYEELSKKVVHYAAGLPLTLKVLGSHLCGRNKHEWVDAIERLKTIPLEKTLKRLEISYDGLEDDQKQIFLDVVCILKGYSKSYAIRILEICGFKAQIGLSILEQKSLITISNIYGLRFHDHIEEMGWNVVRRLHPHSRLWIREEIEDILVNDLGTEATKYIKLNYTNLDSSTIMKGLVNMRELIFLQVQTHPRIADGVCGYLPHALRTLYWVNYPFCYLPKTFQAKHLVNLEMPMSFISQLWEAGEKKVLDKLKFLDLKYSLVSNLDLRMTPHLQTLNLSGCTKLVELHFPVEFPNLRILDCGGSNLRNLNLAMTPNLEKLVLNSCYEFVELQCPVQCLKLKLLDLSGSKLHNFKLGMIPHLEELNLEGCNEFVELHFPVECPNLRILNLCRSKLRYLNLGMTPHLEKLDLNGCNEFVALQCPIECLKLKFLDLSGSKLHTLKLEMIRHLEELKLEGCNEFVELHFPGECPNLKILNLRCSNLHYLKLGMTPRLEELKLEECNKFVELHLPVECPNLKLLNLCGSKLCNLKLGIAPHIKELNLRACTELLELHLCNEYPNLRILNLHGSKLPYLNIRTAPYIEKLYLEECNELLELHLPIECPNLKILYLCGSKLRNFNLAMTPNLEVLDLGGCNELLELNLPDESPNLRILNLRGCKLCYLKLGMTPCLAKLKLIGCNELVELHLPISCPKLRILYILGSKLRYLKLGMTPLLDELDLQGCIEFLELHLHVECPNLRILKLSGTKLRNLNLGMTPHLEELDLEGCNEFLELHLPVECPNLKYLNLGGTKVTSLNLEMTPHIMHLVLQGCYHLKEIHAPMGCLEKLIYIKLRGCSRFKHFIASKHHGPSDESLVTLKLTAKSLNTCPLHPSSNLPKFQFKCYYDEPLLSKSGNIEKLLSFGLCACTDLESFSASICSLQDLRILSLKGSIPELPKDLYKLAECLEKLCLWIKEIKYLPDSICMLRHLKYLDLESCWLLEELPKDLGRLECLEELNLKGCISLQDIPSSICEIKCLRHLYITYCMLVEKLPEELGHLESLTLLDIEGASISRLPQSIYQSSRLLIIGSRWRLESYGFTPLTEMSSPWRGFVYL